jgi:hypothetical protein
MFSAVLDHSVKNRLGRQRRLPTTGTCRVSLQDNIIKGRRRYQSSGAKRRTDGLALFSTGRLAACRIGEQIRLQGVQESRGLVGHLNVPAISLSNLHAGFEKVKNFADVESLTLCTIPAAVVND